MSSIGSSREDPSHAKVPDREDIPREKWSAEERRTELLQRIQDVGHPRELNQSELGKTYGVSQQQISKDFKQIGARIRESLDDDRRALTVNTTVQTSIRGLLEQEKYYKAGKLALEWDTWVLESGVREGTNSDDSRSIAEVLSR